MATIAEMFVDIGADASEFDKETKNMQKQMKGMTGDMRSMAQSMGTSATQMGDDWRHMSDEMKTAFKGAKDSLIPFKKAQQEVKYEFFKMAQGMKDYSGTNDDFMNDLTKLGKKQKKINEDMMKSNEMLKTGFITGVATMLARSGQSDKIASNLERMGGPLYGVNKGLLKVTSNLEGIARAGSPAVLALKMLGPTANMKELNDMTMLINAGLMRFAAVGIVAAAANIMMFKALHKAAADSVPGYKKAFDDMGKAVREAFQPMVDVFGAVMKRVYEFITYIANLVNKFNEAHPVAAKFIQGILMLIVVLTLILAPLAIGIGMIAGMQAAFAAAWMFIGPLITGLGAMMGTVLLVAAAIALVALALWALWTKTDWFKAAVIGAWETIKTKAAEIWTAIYEQGIKPAIDAIVLFVMDQMAKLKQFWDENGQQILAAGQNVWNVISAVIEGVMMAIGAIMKFIWPVVLALILSTWEAIKLGIEGAINVITGIIKFFAALFTGDWKGMWEAVKQILKGAVQLLLSYLQLSFFGGIFKGAKAFATVFKSTFKGMWDNVAKFFTGGVTKSKNTVVNGFNAVVNFIKGLGQTFYNAGKGLIEMMAKGIAGSIGKVLGAMKSVASKARDFLPFSPAKTGPLSDLDKLDFGGPIADSLNSAIPKVKGLMSNLLAMPALGVEGDGDFTGNDVEEARTGITIAQMVVREEADIEKISLRLYKLQQARLRAQGGRN